MRDLFSFIRGKLNPTDLKFHYLRVGRAAPMLEGLRAYTSVDNVEWVHEEVESFHKYHFSSSYAEYDGVILNLGVDEENISTIRRQFWENYIWVTEDIPQLLALIVPDSSSLGSLSKAQIFEALSLIRLTDRPFEIFENKEENIALICNWLTSHASIVHRKERDDTKEESQ